MAEVSVDYELFRRYRRLLGDNVVAFWPFFEQNPGAGEFYSDDGPLGHHITNQVAFDDVPMIRGFMMSPRFNGVDEYCEHADHADFSFGADGTAPNEVCVTIGCWVNPEGTTVSRQFMAKLDDQTTAREWTLYTDAGSDLSFRIWDEGNNACIGREYAGANLPTDEWSFIVGRYAGGGLEVAMDVFLNGVIVDDGTASQGTGYTAMNNTACVVNVAAAQMAAGPVAAQFYGGDMALAAICDHPVLTDATILELYRVGRRLLEV